MVEAMGPATSIFRLSVEDGRLHFRLVAFRFLGLAMPGFLCPACHAVESAVDGRCHFDVPVSQPEIARRHSSRRSVDRNRLKGLQSYSADVALR